MAYGPGSWGSSSGGSYGAGSWGASGGSRSGTSAKPKTSDPKHDLGSAIVRLARTRANVKGEKRGQVDEAILQAGKGLTGPEYKRVVAALPGRAAPSGDGPVGAGGPAVSIKQRFIEQNKPKEFGVVGSAVGTVADSGTALTGKVLNAVSAPVRADLSALAEYSRQYEKQGRPFIPDVTKLDVGKIVQRAKEGGENKRLDTPVSISKEAGDIRKKQGASTQAFGGLIPWKNDLRTNPIGGGKAGNIAFDIGGSIALDPLTYLSFGLGAAAKAGIRAATGILGAERAAAVVEGGIKVLSAEEKARLAEGMAPKVFDAFSKGVRGGVKASFPKPTLGNLKAGHILGTPRTIIPGPLRGLRAAKIIEGTQGVTQASAAAITATEDSARQLTEQGTKLHNQADLAELQGGAAGHVAAMRAQADNYLQAGEEALAEGMKIRGTGSKEASTVAEHLRDTPVGRGLAKVGDLKAIKIARGLFVPRAAVRARFGEGVAESLEDARVRYRGTFQANVEDDVNTLLHAARETGVTNEDLVNIIGPALDIGGAGAAAGLPEELRPMYDALVSVRDRFTRMQVEAGVTHENALHLTDEYFPRILTSEAEKILKGKEGLGIAVPGEASVTRSASGNLQKRTADIESPISEINPAFAAENGGAAKFEENPLTAFSKRSVSAHQDIATKQYVDDILKVTDRSGNPIVRVVKDGARPEPGFTELNIPGVGRIHAPDEIAQEVRKSYELLINDEALKGFVDGLDKWMTLWKGYATVPLPFGLGFHERNAMGNVFNNWLANISPLDPAYAKAQRLQRLIAKGAKQGDVYKFLTPEGRKIVEEARQYDVVGEGFFGVDLPKNTTEPVAVPFRSASAGEKARRVRSGVNPLNTNNALISSGRKLGRAIEENARLAHFINKLDEFGNAADAARSVKKYLFDYGDLTAAERNVFKRGMAFYTFTRKNLPLQAGAILQTPGKYSHLQSTRVAVADSAKKPGGLYPSYLPELGGVPVPKEVSGFLAGIKFPKGIPLVGGQAPLAFKKDKQIVLAPDLPSTAAFNSASPAVKLLTSLPGVKNIPGVPKADTDAAVTDLASQIFSGGAPGAAMSAIQAFAAKQDFFSGRKLVGNVAAPAYALPIAKDRILNGKKQPTITTKQQFLLEGLIPILGKIGSAFPQGDYEQEKAPRRRLSTFTGVRAYPLGKGAERGEAIRRIAALENLFAELRAQGITIESSRTKKSTTGFGR